MAWSEIMKKYWLKFQINFFQQKEIKKLRKLPGGAEYVLIYLQIMLASVPNDGIVQYDGFEEDLSAEIALDIDADVQTVRFVISYLLKFNLMIELDDRQYALLSAAKNIGSETESAERVRRFREKKKAVLQCNGNVTNGNDIKSREEADIDAEVKTEQRKISAVNVTHDVMNLLAQLKLSEADYKKMVGEYGETLVNTQLPLLLEKRCPIRNIGGMLRTACREDWHKHQNEHSQRKSAAAQAIEMIKMNEERKRK